MLTKKQWLLGLTLLSATASAQIGEYRNDFSIGVNGGVVMSSINFVPTVSQGQHVGMTAGLSMRYVSEKYFSSICAIVGEVNVAQIGWKEKIRNSADQPIINSVTGVAEEYSRDITYLQVPVFARMGWGREKKGFQGFFQVGPQVGVFLNEKTDKNFGVSERPTGSVAQDSMAVENKFDYGIAGGAGIEFSHPRVGHFLLEGRYYYGLGNIFGNSKHDYFGRSNFSNITIKLTYLFDIKRRRTSL